MGLSQLFFVQIDATDAPIQAETLQEFRMYLQAPSPLQAGPARKKRRREVGEVEHKEQAAIRAESAARDELKDGDREKQKPVAGRWVQIAARAAATPSLSGIDGVTASLRRAPRALHAGGGRGGNGVRSLGRRHWQRAEPRVAVPATGLRLLQLR